MDRVGRFELVAPAGASAGVAVWRGRDPELNRDVALKQAGDPNSPAARRLRAEGRLLAGLTHPNVVSVYAAIEEDEAVWLVEEWVPGASLAAVTATAATKNGLTPPQAVGVVRGALRGLAFTHERGVTHGDIRSETIRLDASGESKLLDFAPEASSSPRDDVRGSGQVLAALLTGKTATTSDDVHRALREVVSRATADDPAQRYANGGEFLAALEDAAERDLGASWLTQASVAALVAAAGTATTAAATQSGAATPSAGAEALSGAATARVGPKPRRSSRLAIAAGAAVAVIVAGVVVAVAATSSHKKKATGQAANTSHSTSAQRTPVSSAPPSLTPAQAAQAFSGHFGETIVTTALTGVTRTNPYFFAGRSQSRNVTLAGTCSKGVCTSILMIDGDTDPAQRQTFTRTASGSWTRTDTGEENVTCPTLPGLVRLVSHTTLQPSKLDANGVPTEYTGIETTTTTSVSGSCTPITETQQLTLHRL